MTTNNTHKMKFLKKLFSKILPSEQSELEAYIASKNPQNAAEVDFYIRMYEERQSLMTRMYSNSRPDIAKWIERHY